jgi:serine/threonine protein kinase/WD40 repeat protein/Tfp pilus assembly protein PilF
MGIVYEAVQESLGRHVALKVLPPCATSSGTYLERFRREARAAARLHHTNIVPVFGVGESDGTLYYAMQFIQGHGLDAVLTDVKRLRTEGQGGAIRKTLSEPVAFSLVTGRYHEAATMATTLAEAPVAETPRPDLPTSHPSLNGAAAVPYFRSVARLGVQAAEALAHAHSQGILHRDIKPSNLLLDAAGTLWVTDFGLAKSNDAEDLSNTGDIVGTIRYMAPERFDGRSDPRSDVYALGVTLYEMLTLQPAFAAGDKLRLIAQITEDSPATPKKLDPRIPRDLETIVLKAMAFAPAARYQSANDLAEDLRRFLADRPIKARRSSLAEQFVRWCKRNPALAWSLGVIAFLLVLTTVGSIFAAAWLKDQRDDALAARKDADDANKTMKDKLWLSLKERARSGVLSRREGQRFETLAAIREAVEIGRERGSPETERDELRNLAVAALTLPDVQVMSQWRGWPRGTFSLAADASASLRETSLGAEVAKIDGIAGAGELYLSPDGRFVVQKEGELLRSWRVDSSGRPSLLEDHRVTGWAFTHESDLLRMESDGSVWLSKLGSPHADRKIVKIPGSKHVLNADPVNGRFACLMEHGLQIFDLHSGRSLAHVAANWSFSEQVALNPEGDVFAFADGDGRIHVWDVANDRELAELKGVTNLGIRVSFVCGGELLATSGWEGKLRLWDWRAKKQVMMFAAAVPQAFHVDDRLFVSDDDERTAVWRITPALEYRSISLSTEQAGEQNFWGAQLHPSGRILTQTASQSPAIYDLDRGLKLATLSEGSMTSASHLPGTVLTNTWNGVARHRLEFRDGAEPLLRINPPERLNLQASDAGIATDRDGSTVAVSVFSGAVFSVGNGPSRFVTHNDCRSVAVSPEGRWLATGGHEGGAIRVWRVDDGAMMKELLPGFKFLYCTFSPGGAWLATAGEGGLRLWTVDSWEAGPTIGRAVAFGFNADDSLLAVETGGGRIRLLQPATGRELARLDDPNQDEASWLGFTPDGTRLVTSSKIGKAIHVWDLRRIRSGLVELGLDWDAPPFPPTPAVEKAAPIRVENLAAKSPPPPAYSPVKASDVVALQTLAIALQPYNPRAYYNRARARAATNDNRGAHADVTTAIQLQPGQLRFHELRMNLGQLLNLPDSLVEDYRALLKINPRDAVSSNNLAWMYAAGPLKYRDPAAALVLAQAAERADPNNGVYLNTLGVTLYRLGRYDDALRPLERSSQKAPDFAAWNNYFLAMCHQKRNETVKARECFDRAVKWHTDATLKPSDALELKSFRTEAAAVLGLTPPAD